MKIDPKFRYEMKTRGWMRKSDIRPFTGCKQREIDTIWKSIQTDMKREGIESMDGIVLTKRVMKFIGLTEKDIDKAYEKSYLIDKSNR